MSITMISIGCQDKSKAYRTGYLDALLSKNKDPEFFPEKHEYLQGYNDANIRRIIAKKAQFEFNFHQPHKCRPRQPRCSCGKFCLK